MPNIYYKISRNQMNKALIVFNNALNKLNDEIKYYEKTHIKLNLIDENNINQNLIEGLQLKKKKEELLKYIEIVNFSIKQTKLKEFYIDYDFAVLIKTILFIEEK